MDQDDKENESAPRRNQSNPRSRTAAPLRARRFGTTATTTGGTTPSAGLRPVGRQALARRSAVTRAGAMQRATASSAPSGGSSARIAGTPAASSQQAHPAANPANPPSAAVPVNTPPTTQTSTGNSGRTRVFSQRVHPRNSTQKHAPIGPRGTIILLSDNKHLTTAPVKKGEVEPQKLKLRLKDTKGNIHNRFFPDKDANRWDNSKWISDANKWRNQVLRRLFRHDPEFKGRSVRPKWGMVEATALKTKLKAKVEAAGGQRLTAGEWKELATEHNRQFAGKKIKEGDRLVGGERARNTQNLGARTVTALRALFDRNKELKAFYNDLVGENVTTEDVADEAMMDGEMAFVAADEMDLDGEEEESDQDSATKKGKGSGHSGVIDPRLEDPSDDEDEDRRPALTQTSAGLISCA